MMDDQQNTHSTAAPPLLRHDRNWLIFLGLAVLAILVRVQAFNDPVIGFDEQFYLLVGDRMLHGAIPYVDLWDRKPIGLFLIYAFSAALGHDPFLQYKLVATLFVTGTAFALYRTARLVAPMSGAIVAAGLYILWLNLSEGESGQAPVFYNLPVSMAALLTAQACKDRRHIVRRGCAAMLLIGLALQIKYTVVFEGVFLGVALLWAQFRASGRFGAMLLPGLAWIGCALSPTAIALAAYWRIGALDDFLFANFLSIFGKNPDPASDQVAGLLVIVGILLPLLCVVIAEWRRNPGLNFALCWLGAAIFGLLAFGSYLAPGYALPVIVPLCLATAPFFAFARRRRAVAVGLLGLALIVGQVLIGLVIFNKGGRAEAMAVAAAAQPRHGCIWVYDGYPALYMLTHSCVPTRWSFPGHLNTANEGSITAIGVDPVAEVTRILATRPDVIVNDAPAYSLGNPATRALVESALQRDYRLVFKQRTGKARYRLVYRLK